jgi:starch phosphorylase
MPPPIPEPRDWLKDVQPGNDAASIRRDFVTKLFFELAKFPGVATRNDHYMALALALRDRLLHRWLRSARTYLEGEHRTVIYLSAEYLLGPQLAHNVLNLGLDTEVRTALHELGLELDDLIEHEEEPGLGNGGLGRLAACFMDSLATLAVPAIGHGIRYEFGIFDQEIRDGWQVERTDRWLRLGNPWEVRRFEIAHPVGYGGHVEHETGADGRYRARWIPARIVRGIPSDTPVLGYGTGNANFLRLWSAFADEELDLDAFQGGEYLRAVDAKVHSENISKVLYPNDASPQGKQLRLGQEYFFVSCALQDCIRLLLQKTTIDRFADKFTIQLNDTHPSLAVPELMRLLVDEHNLSWEDAWELTTRSIAYTNHTLMPEALETWPLPLMAQLLPRHLEIILEINARFLAEVRRQRPGDEALVSRVSLVDERGERSIRMAYLATVAAKRVNGVAELHSKLLRETVLRDFSDLYPGRFINVTNGVTPRRFVALANPRLATLLDESIGPGWLTDLDRLERLRPYADDAAFRARWREVKLANKQDLAAWLHTTHGRIVDPTSLLDAQCKRIHEYKRQHLNLLYVAWLHAKIDRGELDGVIPRTVLLAGKAAPGYRTAKLIIRLATAIAEGIADDPRARERLAVVFVPDFNVKTAQRIYPAADLSEQISTAGKEASGTGNMKFALSGALTIGTLDGANIEIRDAVGARDFFLFGMTAEEVETRWKRGYHPREVLAADPELAALLRDIGDGRYTPREKDVLAPLVRNLVDHDPFMVLADFRSYVEAQERVATAWGDVEAWTAASIRNVAGMGRFSSDRSIRDYLSEVWEVPPVKV